MRLSIMYDSTLLPWLGSHRWRCEWTLRCLVRDLMNTVLVDDIVAGVKEESIHSTFPCVIQHD